MGKVVEEALCEFADDAQVRVRLVPVTDGARAALKETDVDRCSSHQYHEGGAQTRAV